ncbi:hypothetical protein BJ508DRAFT_379720 [Ascobolus immersus RN42]|uniref:LysM domain-containing protein n=1 Tax=Ascobolus immersus RN42 TaxID=1160509 RepID=A0A3N4HQ97_ASCIM|nr:hypothetical protein BJ508DRAFT_379720 [Ascobolus immersus RN42]
MKNIIRFLIPILAAASLILGSGILAKYEHRDGPELLEGHHSSFSSNSQGGKGSDTEPGLESLLVKRKKKNWHKGFDKTGISSTSTSQSTVSSTSTASAASNGTTTQTPAPAPREFRAAPGSIQGAQDKNCNKWLKAEGDDTCYAVTAAAGISMCDLKLWNPYIEDDCSNLWVDFDVCVGVKA